MATYTFYQDGGHGWLKVKKSELFALGIADKISSYSYQYKEWAYLEEDCDLSLFFNAKGWQGTADFWKSGTIKNAYSHTRSKIRGYHHYQAVPYIKPQIGDWVEILNSPIKKLLLIDKNRGKDEHGMTYRIPANMIGSAIKT